MSMEPASFFVRTASIQRGAEMYFIMTIYYIISAFVASMLLWNFVREKEDREKMLLYLIVLIPFVLRIMRIR